MQLYFIRHAQSENNKLWAEGRPEEERVADPLLTETGREQAQLLAAYLANGSREAVAPSDRLNGQGIHLTHLYSSLMLRAVATANYIAEAIGMHFTGWEEIHEGGGIYLYDPERGEDVGLPGASGSFLAEQYPSFVLPPTLGEEGWWRSQPREPWEAVPARARTFLTGLLEQHGGTDHRVAIVSHGGFFHALLQALLDFPAAKSFDEAQRVFFVANNTAISRFDFEDSEVRIMYLNRVDHLPPDLIT